MNQHSIILLLSLVIAILCIYLTLKHNSGENYRFSIWDTDCNDAQIAKCQLEGWTSSPQCEFCDNA
jgi:hypothetical protein